MYLVISTFISFLSNLWHNVVEHNTLIFLYLVLSTYPGEESESIRILIHLLTALIDFDIFMSRKVTL